MKQASYTCLRESTRNVIYPIYMEDCVCETVCKIMNANLDEIVNKEYGTITQVHTLGNFSFQKIIFLGLGSKELITTKKIRNAVEMISTKLDAPASFLLKKAITDSLDASTLAKLISESYDLGIYQEVKVGHESSVSVDLDMIYDELLEESLKEGMAFAQGINHARDLANTPANYMTPSILAKEAKEVADRYGMDCQVLWKKELEACKAGGILSVNQGSDEEPCMIILTYHGDNEAPYTALVGKGITFDSGGYNIKSNSYGMKYDMCGAADVLGVIEILAATKAKCNVYAIIPATENLINGKAYKPQDVITTMAGKTIEIVSTDAEGRLILCDGITYAQILPNVDRIVDIATLTGACVGALGDEYAGIFSNDDRYYETFHQVMVKSDEKGWRLPLDEAYLNKLKSNSADLKNSVGKPGAGASVAANFLQEFVNEGIKWIHIDIAGVSDHPEKGATGKMIRSLVNLCMEK